MWKNNLDKIRELYDKLTCEEQREFRKMLDAKEPNLVEAPRRPGNFIPMKPGRID